MSTSDDSIELPASLEEYLREEGEEEATVVIPAAEGWRYSSAEIDVASDEAHKQSRDLRDEGIARIKTKKLSPGEELLLERAAEEEI